MAYTVKPVLCDLPRERWNKVAKSGLIDMKCTVMGNWNKGHIIQVLLNTGGH